MQKFGVKIDLSSYFGDERKFVMLLVDASWESVEVLQNRVEKLFEIDSVRFLTNDGYFIPSQEPIEIVKLVDGIKAFIPRKCLESRRSKKKASLDAGEQDEQSPPLPAEEIMVKKRKYYSLGTGLVSSTPNQAKRSKYNAVHATIECEPNMGKSNEISSTSNIQKLKDCVAQETYTTQESPPKKRKRQHKRKNSTAVPAEKTGESDSLDNSISSINAMSLCAANVTDNRVSAKKAPLLPKSKPQEDEEESQTKTHIRFSDCGDLVSTTTEPPPTENPEYANADKIVFRCALSELQNNKPRVFAVQPSSKTFIAKRSHVEIQEQIIILPPKLSHSEDLAEQKSTGGGDLKGDGEISTISEQTGSVMLDGTEATLELAENTIKEDVNKETATESQKKSEETSKNESSVIDLYDENESTKNKSYSSESSDVIELNESDDEVLHYDTDCTENTPRKRKMRYSNILKMLPSSVPLKDLPDCGTYVIFKMPLKYGKNMTDYIVGKSEYTNKRLKLIKMVLVGGQPGVEEHLSQYACNMDDSKDENFVMKIKLTDMIDPVVYVAEED